MHFAKLMMCEFAGRNIVVNIRITDAAWNKCNVETQLQTEKILQSEPIRLMGPSDHGKGIKREPDHWVLHTQTGQRLATATSDGSDPTNLEWSGMSFTRVYNH